MKIVHPKKFEHQLHVTELEKKVAHDFMWRVREDNEHLRVSSELLKDGSVLIESVDCVCIQNNTDLHNELEAIANRAINGQPERVYEEVPYGW